MGHICLTFTNTSKEINEILIALLVEEGFEGFEEEEYILKAYILEKLFNKEHADQLASKFDVIYSVEEFPETNWNSLWESNFDPVTIGDFCGLRADFHAPLNNVRHDIIITPKMSFGTGHHHTTYMMVQQMERIDFNNKQVLDFGTGTGVLAVLAKKSGASRVVAIDYDDWSIENAAENFEKNKVTIELIKADTAVADGVFDIILANITLNVILDNFLLFRSLLNTKGILVLSGLLDNDVKSVLDKASACGLVFEDRLQRGGWNCLTFRNDII